MDGNTFSWEHILVAVITGIVSLLAGGGGVYAFLSNMYKSRFDAQRQTRTDDQTYVSDQWRALLTERKCRTDELDKKVVDLDHEIDGFRDERRNNISVLMKVKAEAERVKADYERLKADKAEMDRIKTEHDRLKVDNEQLKAELERLKGGGDAKINKG